ncbi:MAG: hypothetical protein ABSA46_06875 [Thermodesulfovibrionales bacterium]|jgi:hypothetical protein
MDGKQTEFNKQNEKDINLLDHSFNPMPGALDSWDLGTATAMGCNISKTLCSGILSYPMDCVSLLSFSAKHRVNDKATGKKKMAFLCYR